MATRTRNQPVKSDIADQALLAHIPTTGLVRQSRQALFYAILQDLDFANLGAALKPLAITYASLFCTWLDAIDARGMKNEADLERRLAQRLDSEKLVQQLLQLYKALQTPTKGRRISTDAIDDQSLDLQELYRNLTDD